MYINKQQIYFSERLYVHKSYIPNNTKGTISEYKGVLHCRDYDYEESTDSKTAFPFPETFFTRRMKMLIRPDSFTLYGKLGVARSALLNCCIRKWKLRND